VLKEIPKQLREMLEKREHETLASEEEQLKTLKAIQDYSPELSEAELSTVLKEAHTILMKSSSTPSERSMAKFICRAVSEIYALWGQLEIQKDEDIG